MSLTVVFVHGYSVTNIDTYGELPIRLKAEAALKGIQIELEDIYLGRYISFHDEVKLNDISRAFESAVNDKLAALKKAGKRFICITHSTGGPVVRNWWKRYYKDATTICPMSHLIMLAPANFGSALAILGKGKLSRLNSWWEGVEPGIGVLNWLCLGSNDSFELNKDWIKEGGKFIGEKGIFPFVIIGQDIDRKFYDHLNTYTGEIGSDGVVRVAAANLEGRYIKLVQPFPTKTASGKLYTSDFSDSEFVEATPTPLRVLTKKSHSGDEMGIMKSVKKGVAQDISSETIQAILNCIQVQDANQYETIRKQFEAETATVQANSILEKETGIFKSSRYFIHLRHSMVVFRITDTEGYPVTDYDLILTAGENNDPNHLPEGFLADRQKNALNPETVTFFFNYDVMNGTPELKDENGKIIRPKIEGAKMMGFQINPRPDSGFVQYIPCKIVATEAILDNVLKPNSTTLIDIVLQRVVDKEVFQFESTDGPDMPSTHDGDFSETEPSGEIVN